MYELDFSACQERRERQDDQKAEEWGFATLELAELVRIWGKQAIETELAKLPDAPPVQYQPLCAQRMAMGYAKIRSFRAAHV